MDKKKDVRVERRNYLMMKLYTYVINERRNSTSQLKSQVKYSCRFFLTGFSGFEILVYRTTVASGQLGNRAGRICLVTEKLSVL
jgi:hypothetical protein